MIKKAKGTRGKRAFFLEVGITARTTPIFEMAYTKRKDGPLELQNWVDLYGDQLNRARMLLRRCLGVNWFEGKDVSMDV